MAESKRQLVPHPTDQQIHDAGMTRRGYMEAYRIQEKAAKIQTARDKDAADMRANGWTGDRRADRFEPAPADPATVKAFQLTKNRLYAATVAENEQICRTAYSDFKKNGEFTTEAGKRAGVLLLNTLGYTLANASEGVRYLRSEDAAQRFR